jgi:uncharacterized protein (DUF1499 family)
MILSECKSSFTLDVKTVTLQQRSRCSGVLLGGERAPWLHDRPNCGIMQRSRDAHQVQELGFITVMPYPCITCQNITCFVFPTGVCTNKDPVVSFRVQSLTKAMTAHSFRSLLQKQSVVSIRSDQEAWRTYTGLRYNCKNCKTACTSRLKLINYK